MDYEQDDEEAGDHGSDYAAPAEMDLFSAAIALCQIAERSSTIVPALKKLRKLGRDITAAQRKLAAVEGQVEQTNAALAQRAAELDERARTITQREDDFAASIEQARDHLRGYYDSIAEVDRHIRYRILSSADLLSGYNPQLQDLPSWQVLRTMVAGLPPDPPPLEREVAAHPRIDAFSDTFSDPHADRTGLPFLGELTRDVSHKRSSV
jgi:hypothetical protein